MWNVLVAEHVECASLKEGPQVRDFAGEEWMNTCITWPQLVC